MVALVGRTHLLVIHYTPHVTECARHMKSVVSTDTIFVLAPSMAAAIVSRLLKKPCPTMERVIIDQVVMRPSERLNRAEPLEIAAILVIRYVTPMCRVWALKSKVGKIKICGKLDAKIVGTKATFHVAGRGCSSNITIRVLVDFTHERAFIQPIHLGILDDGIQIKSIQICFTLRPRATWMACRKVGIISA